MDKLQIEACHSSDGELVYCSSGTPIAKGEPKLRLLPGKSATTAVKKEKTARGHGLLQVLDSAIGVACRLASTGIDNQQHSSVSVLCHSKAKLRLLALHAGSLAGNV